MLQLHIGKAELSLPEEGIQTGINHALVALPGSPFDGKGGDFQPIPKEIRKERSIFSHRLQFCCRFNVKMFRPREKRKSAEE